MIIVGDKSPFFGWSEDWKESWEGLKYFPGSAESFNKIYRISNKCIKVHPKPLTNETNKNPFSIVPPKTSKNQISIALVTLSKIESMN
jgi:hypothetical protein